MQTRIQTISATKYLAMPCSRCGANELQPRLGTLLLKLSGVTRFACRRCGHRESEYRPNLSTVGLFVLLVATVGSIVFFSTQSNIFQRNDDVAAGNESMALARTSAAGLSAFEKIMIRKPRTTLNNATVLRLWRADVGTDVILQTIRTSTADYDVGANSLIELRQAGVDKVIVLAMIDATYEAR
jgi:DNA-directed RNA polymerase subunit RPC12/RpoP